MQPTTPQALELVNGEILNQWLLFGARRMLGEERPAPASLYNRAVAGRNARPVPFSVSVADRQAIWLLVQEQGSNDPERVLPVWARTEFVNASGATTPLAALRPIVDGLAATFGPTCEVVLHDYRTPERSVVAVAGAVTGRNVGRALSEIGLRTRRPSASTSWIAPTSGSDSRNASRR